MLNKYNLASVTLPSGTGATSNASVSPLFFPRAGNISSNFTIASGDSYNVGNFGCAWSSTIRDAEYAYNLYFSDTNVIPSDNYYRYRGLPVRCLVN